MKSYLPLPPLEQLAALAACINTERTAQGKVDTAIDIWQLAHQRIEHHNKVRAKSDQSSAQIDAIMKGRIVHDNMPLDAWLKELFPKSKPEDTMKWYRDYLTDTIPAHRSLEGKSPLSEPELEAAVKVTIQKDREEGVNFAYLSAVQFLKYRNTAAQKARSERGKKGAEKKHLVPKKEAKNGTSKTKRAPSKAKRAPSKK
jgi:hypothetical protein